MLFLLPFWFLTALSIRHAQIIPRILMNDIACGPGEGRPRGEKGVRLERQVWFSGERGSVSAGRPVRSSRPGKVRCLPWEGGSDVAGLRRGRGWYSAALLSSSLRPPASCHSTCHVVRHDPSPTASCGPCTPWGRPRPGHFRIPSSVAGGISP